jgi:dihydroorotase
MPFDLIIKGGRVIDPANDIDAIRDVAVNGERIAAVEPSIPQASAKRVIDAANRLVTPGLIDMHTHVFWGANHGGIDADSIAWRSGVTTWIDAGSAGAYSIPGLREYVAMPAEARIKAFINISYLGLVGLNYDEYCNPLACNVDLLARVVDQSRDFVVGIKARMGEEGFCYPGLEPLRRAVRASEMTGLRVMCHLSGTPPPLRDVLALLRAGDIVTHSFTGAGEKLVDGRGRILAAVLRARDAGILFDVGHGAGSFSFESAEALAGHGFWPDTLSTDLHQGSMPGPNLVEDQENVHRVRGDGSPHFTLLTVMTKFLYLGLPIDQLIRAVTSRPAELIGMPGEIGTLRPGSTADIAILDIERGTHELYDIHGLKRSFDRQFRSVLTLRAGREMVQKPVPPPPPWVRLVDLEDASAAAGAPEGG